MGDFKAIGKAFIDFYYSKFDTGPREGVAALYVSLNIILFSIQFIFLYLKKGTY
jgi:hypothetical protein